MSTLGGPNIIRDGLKVFYDFSNIKSYPETGTTALDLSKNQNGTINTATYGVYDGVKSLDFDGTYGSNGYVDSLSTNVTDSSFTAIVWCRTTNINRLTDVQGRVIAGTFDYQGNGVGNDTGWYLGNTWTGNHLWFSVKDGNGASTTVTFSSTWFTSNLDNWVFIAGVFSAGNYIKGFQNDSQIISASTTITTLSAQTSSLKWARRSAESQSNWMGQLGACMYYDRALTDEEVLQIYNATKSRFGL